MLLFVSFWKCFRLGLVRGWELAQWDAARGARQIVVGCIPIYSNGFSDSFSGLLSYEPVVKCRRSQVPTSTSWQGDDELLSFLTVILFIVKALAWKSNVKSYVSKHIWQKRLHLRPYRHLVPNAWIWWICLHRVVFQGVKNWIWAYATQGGEWCQD